ncbi:MAG: ABC transporter ATP-binding protein [Calditrichaeota bacterium]|nr:ABC transporter ATP-binding protein [Calditrichota bacterium]MCB9391073.1 ABC transporter ATP-binding protein [Calditrichota bacterium]
MIESRNLKKSFGEKQVLQGVDLTIPTAESLVIIGQSGCGKSVFLKHLVGLLDPDEGEVYVDGDRISNAVRADVYRIRMKFGVLFQSAALFDSMTVMDNVSLGLIEHTDMSRSEITKRVAACLEMVSLPGTEKLKPSELSGGMRKRVGLARAIAMKPKYILYDEPTTGLDPITADSINDLIISLNEELDVTTIVVTHDMVSAFKIADRIVMLHEGKVVFTGTPAETKSTKLGIVRRFIEGESEDQSVVTHY